MLPRIFRATQMRDGNWITWMWVEKPEPVWDSTRRVYILDDLKTIIVRGNEAT